MLKQNTEDTQYKRDTDLHGSPSVGYVEECTNLWGVNTSLGIKTAESKDL